MDSAALTGNRIIASGYEIIQPGRYPKSLLEIECAFCYTEGKIGF